MADYLYLSGRGRRQRGGRLKPQLAWVGALTALGLGLFIFLATGSGSEAARPSRAAEASAATEPRTFDKSQLAELIGRRPDGFDGSQVLDIADPQSGRALFIRTTLDHELQNRAQRWVNASLAHQAALVVMKADNGEVLALAGYRAREGEGNAALDGSFPAASIFKIVTAAAAVEKGDFRAESKLAYDGGKYSLYKKSVAREPERGLHQATLEKSFAESINTVFGKLGSSLGSEELTYFAERFGFNRRIDFELPVAVSRFSIEADEPFHLAELASGYNRTTKVSPLHGAMLAASVVSGGRLVEPTLVRDIFDQDNHSYYYGRAGEPSRAVSENTAGELYRMMRKTVEEGTGRRGFSGAAKDPVLSRLWIGGKSGSINNDEGQRVDWFVAWAQPKEGEGCADTLALSAVVVHGAGSATNSQKLIRQAIVAYYKDKVGPAAPSRSASRSGSPAGG